MSVAEALREPVVSASPAPLVQALAEQPAPAPLVEAPAEAEALASQSTQIAAQRAEVAQNAGRGAGQLGSGEPVWASRRAQPIDQGPAAVPLGTAEVRVEEMMTARPAPPAEVVEAVPEPSAPVAAAPAPALMQEAAGRSEADPFPLQPQERGVVQDRVRDKSLQIARLSASLTQAAGAGDEAETQRLLDALEVQAGAQSSYYLNMLAYVALTREQYTEVEAILGLVLSRHPDDANAGLNMAVAESRTGRLKEARQRLQQMVLAHPDDSRIGSLLASLGER